MNVHEAAFHDSPLAGHPATANQFLLRAKIIRVKDGDTVVCWLDEGDDRTLTSAVRFTTVDCPELSAEGGYAAQAFTRSVLPNGSWIQVRTRKQREENGRLLGDVFAQDADGKFTVNVSEQIVATGHGTRR